MRAIARALEPLDEHERLRALSWALSRELGVTPANGSGDRYRMALQGILAVDKSFSSSYDNAKPLVAIAREALS